METITILKPHDREQGEIVPANKAQIAFLIKRSAQFNSKVDMNNLEKLKEEYQEFLDGNPDINNIILSYIDEIIKMMQDVHKESCTSGNAEEVCISM